MLRHSTVKSRSLSLLKLRVLEGLEVEPVWLTDDDNVLKPGFDANPPPAIKRSVFTKPGKYWSIEHSGFGAHWSRIRLHFDYKKNIIILSQFYFTLKLTSNQGSIELCGKGVRNVHRRIVILYHYLFIPYLAMLLFLSLNSVGVRPVIFLKSLAK